MSDATVIKDILRELKRINKRLDKLEKVSHKQPSMKEMLRNAQDVLKAAQAPELLKTVDWGIKPRSPRDTGKRYC
jgi:hypothetical protein